MIYSGLFKAKAREALRNHWQTALLIALIVSLPSLLVQGLAAFTGNDLLSRMEQLLIDASVSAAAMDALPDTARAVLSEPGILMMTGLSLLAWIVTPVLALGMNHWVLDRIRGAEEPVSAVFSRVRLFLKSVGLRLFIALKVLLWMLPGIAVCLLAVIPLTRADLSSSSSMLSAAQTSIYMMYGGMAVMLVLGVMGYLYYAVADFILADEPEERVVTCTRRSKMLMKGRRGALLSLMLSFLLWYILVIFVTAMIETMAGTVIALMLQMLGNLFISAYMLTSEGVFYEALRKAPVPQVAVDPPESAGL